MKPEFDYSSVTVPSTALFVATDEPLLIFPSVTAAELYLEAIDVENGVYPIAYGPNGEPHRIANEGNRVIIEPTDEPDRPGELRILLVRYLTAIGRAPDATETLAQLVAADWLFESKPLPIENLIPLKRAAAASLVASLLLVTIPFAVPDMSIAPFALANWCLFMLFSYLYLKSFRWPITFGDSERVRMKLCAVVFLAFTVAGWVALANTNNLV